jgi:hypothetical protein
MYKLDLIEQHYGAECVIHTVIYRHRIRAQVAAWYARLLYSRVYRELRIPFTTRVSLCAAQDLV